ncbi:MAG: hypothetical protein AAF754_18305 [Pseudomonadota bacterium]
MRETDWKVRMSAHHMDHLSAIFAVVFAFRKSRGLIVEEMTTSFDLTPARTTPLNGWIGDIRYFAAKDVSRPRENAASAKWRNRTAASSLRLQLIAATQASDFSAWVWYCKVFLGRSLNWRATALSLA